MAIDTLSFPIKTGGCFHGYVNRIPLPEGTGTILPSLKTAIHELSFPMKIGDVPYVRKPLPEGTILKPRIRCVEHTSRWPGIFGFGRSGEASGS